jgi:hypothetical protein
MALAQVHGVVVSGVTGALVQVEVDVASGLPSVGVVGLPDTSVSESRWRARSALGSIGAAWPNRRVTISLSPAEVRKNGAGLDLAIAIGVLAASDQLPGISLASTTLPGAPTRWRTCPASGWCWPALPRWSPSSWGGAGRWRGRGRMSRRPDPRARSARRAGTRVREVRPRWRRPEVTLALVGARRGQDHTLIWGP